MIRILLARLQGLFPSAGREQGKGGGAAPIVSRGSLWQFATLSQWRRPLAPRGGRRESSVWKP